jgi:hypothetical protein
MVSLVDIVPQTRVVQLAAGELELRGLGLRQIANLFIQFPASRNIFTEGAPEVDALDLIMMAPEAMAAIIAEASGQPGAADAIVNGSALSPDEALDCLQAIAELTFPRGVAPLLARVMALLGSSVGAGPSGRDQVMTMQPPPNGSLPEDTLLPT